MAQVQRAMLISSGVSSAYGQNLSRLVRNCQFDERPCDHFAVDQTTIYSVKYGQCLTLNSKGRSPRHPGQAGARWLQARC